MMFLWQLDVLTCLQAEEAAEKEGEEENGYDEQDGPEGGDGRQRGHVMDANLELINVYQ